jgi:NhaA family Na+:H+ antiporter
VTRVHRRARENVGAALEYLRDETVGGAVLLVAACAALVWANASDGYFEFWEQTLTIGVGSLSITEDLRHWVNDGLMAIFFFVVALEIKRELVLGELSDRRTALVPVLAAFGGAALPVAIFFLVVGVGGDDHSGWAIPMATDIAFAVGVLALLGDRIPPAAKLLLLTIAVVDDVVAIAVIAAFYTESLSLAWLALATAGVGGIVALRALSVPWTLAYVPFALVVWVGLLESGVHATMAGVIVGLLTPTGRVAGKPVLEHLEERLHPLSAYVAVPLFALANAGVVINETALEAAASSAIAWGVLVGLVVGKLVGIAGTMLVTERLGIGRLPDGVTRGHIWGIAALGGIGFTVSLFIAQLAYTDPATVDASKIAIFAASIVSAALGSAILLRASRRRPTAG